MDWTLQYRNMTTVLTREYLDSRPDGWLEYAAKRIAQLYGSQHFLLTPALHFYHCYLIHCSWFEYYLLSDLISLFYWIRGSDKCYNRSLCEEHLNLILAAKPPFRPRQFKTCAVVGNSGDLLKTEFGDEIDSHDVVIRDNEAPVNKV